jgi:hypothetical protein
VEGARFSVNLCSKSFRSGEGGFLVLASPAHNPQRRPLEVGAGKHLRGLNGLHVLLSVPFSHQPLSAMEHASPRASTYGGASPVIFALHPQYHLNWIKALENTCIRSFPYPPTMITAMKPRHMPRPSGSFFRSGLPSMPYTSSSSSRRTPLGLPGMLLIGGGLVGLHLSIEATKQARRDTRKRDKRLENSSFPAATSPRPDGV